MADIRNMFAKMASQSGEGDAPDPEEAPRPKPKAKPTIEKTYQKKSQLEHILLRPDTYIGSVEKASENMWIYDEDKQAMVQKQIEFVPGLYKIFDEILVNAADNKQRDSKMDCIKIDIRPEENLISVWNNGHGIPVVMHKEENMYVPTMIFGHLLTSSNYNDEEEKVTGGRNGYGAKLCNIFSSKFTVETASKEYKRQFKQTWASNMTKTTEPKIREFSGEEFTKITFSPDLTKFGMDSLDEDIVALMSRRAYDVAASSRGVRVFLNGKRLPIKNFKDYIDLFVKNREEENVKIVYDNPHERWEIGVTPSTVEQGFQQMSFVNSIATTKGGKHVDYIVDMMVKQLLEVIKKKNKGGANIKPLQVKNHMWVFINCLIVNPSFDSQTKENMTLQSKNFGSKVTLNEKFIQQVQKSGLVENVLTWAKFKAETELAKTSGKKQTKLKGIPKLEDANEAGTKNGIKCTLILTEGDSAKTLAVSGLGIVGRDYYGVFPLKGKLLNVREATHKQLLENQEINSLIRIMGLQYKKKYNSVDDMKTLRYGKIMIMTDQDQDGSHIKGLLINFIHYNWPELLRQKFLEVFITPLVKVKKRNEEHCFYSLPEFEEWKSNTPNHKTYSVKYYKGLGTSTAQEAKEYFRNMERHRIPFRYQGPQDDDHIVLAFSKKHIEHRKEWLTNFMVESKRRKELGLPEKYLYTKDRKFVTFTDFVNLELVLFSNADNIRSIPSVVDGLKPGQRKVMFTCFKRNDKKEVKVAQLSGSVAEMSAYHHGEASLCMTIVNLAQNFVGSNNINLLEPRGQFGTRLQGGKDSASPRYIFTKMSPLTRLIFHPDDEPLLKHEYDDNQKIEPVWYAPIIPMVLVNGADGIGTGWMTKIPNFNPREIVSNIRLMLDDNEPVDMQPWYKNFTGMIESCGDHRYVVSGEIFTLGDNKVEITELPVLTWTQNYKENVLEPLLCDSDKPSLKGAAKGGKGAGKATKSAEKATKADKTDKESDKSTDKQKFAISDYKEYHTDTTVKFLVTMSPEQLRTMRNEGLHKVFKLQTSISTACMYAFDELGCIKRYESVLDLLGDFYTLRLNMYQKRKDYLEGMLQAEADKLSNQARFILEKCNGTLTVENKKRKIIVEELKRRGYDPDPVATWKEKVKVEQDDEAEDQSQNEGEENEREAAKSTKEGDSDDVKKYDYLLGMSMWMLTDERKSELLRQRDTKLTELEVLRRKSHKDLWRQDLDVFMEKLDKVEEKEREDEQEGSKGKKKGTLGKKKITLKETMPSPMGERIVPAISDEMKKKIQNAIKMRENKGKRAMKKDISAEVEKDEFDLLLEDTRTLKQKLGTPEEPKKGGKRMKQSKLDFKKKEVSVNGSPKKKKKKGGSDSEESINTSGSDSEIEFSGVSSPVVKARVTSRRAATKTIKYDVSEESEASSAEELHENHAVKEDGNHAQRILSDESEDEMPAPRNAPSSEDLFDSLVGRKKSSSPSPDSSEEAAHKRKRIIDDDSEDMFQGNPEPEKKKKTAKAAEKKSKPKKAKRESDDEDFNLPKDDDSDIEMLEGSPPPQKKKASKTNGEKKSKSKKAKKGSGSEDEDFNLPKKKSKKKQVISVSSESEDDDIPPPPKVEREGRNTKKSKYVFDSDSSD